MGDGNDDTEFSSAVSLVSRSETTTHASVSSSWRAETTPASGRQNSLPFSQRGLHVPAHGGVRCAAVAPAGNASGTHAHTTATLTLASLPRAQLPVARLRAHGDRRPAHGARRTAHS